MTEAEIRAALHQRMDDLRITYQEISMAMYGDTDNTGSICNAMNGKQGFSLAYLCRMADALQLDLMAGSDETGWKIVREKKYWPIWQAADRKQDKNAWTDEQLAQETGMKLRTLKHWYQFESDPGLTMLLGFMGKVGVTLTMKEREAA